jgi:hypothetical protein
MTRVQAQKGRRHARYEKVFDRQFAYNYSTSSGPNGSSQPTKSQLSCGTFDEEKESRSGTRFVRGHEEEKVARSLGGDLDEAALQTAASFTFSPELAIDKVAQFLANKSGKAPSGDQNLRSS